MGSEVGSVDGAVVGVDDGAVVGVDDGAAVGNDDGVVVGDDDGAVVGVYVGIDVGANEGLVVGSVDGSAVGKFVGITVGAALGVDVGFNEGSAVGAVDGAEEGDTDGFAVSHLSDGADVGEWVGLHLTGMLRGKVVFLGSAVLSGGFSSVGSLGIDGAVIAGADGLWFFFEFTFVGIAVGSAVGHIFLQVGFEVGSIAASRLKLPSSPTLASDEVSKSNGKKFTELVTVCCFADLVPH